MGGNDNLICQNFLLAAQHILGGKFRHPGVFVNLQILADRLQEFQGMELTLIGKPYRCRKGNWQGGCILHLRLGTQTLQHRKFLFYFLLPLQRIGVGGLCFKITGGFFCDFCKIRDGFLVYIIIFFCGFQTKIFYQICVNQTVKGGDFCGGAGGDPGGDSVCLHKGAVDSCLFELIGTEQTADTAADDQHIGFQIPLQFGKFRQFYTVLPDRCVHKPTSLFGSSMCSYVSKNPYMAAVKRWRA